MNYLELLRKSAEETKSITCMGLDPVVEAMPEKHQNKNMWGFVDFLNEVFNEMKKQNVLPGAFKPNHGFYAKHNEPRNRDFMGYEVLAKVLDMIDEMFPQIPIILDYKRGDIAKSSKNYAEEGFESWKPDAVTVAPYMGTDSVMPFAEYCNSEKSKGIYILNRTSNKGAKDLQNLDVFVGDSFDPLDILMKMFSYEKLTMPFYIVVADKIIKWAENNPGVGAVVGATSLNELSNLTEVYAGKDIPLLIPGVGGQGGEADEVVAILKDEGYDLRLARINSSSGITHPWVKKKEKAPKDYAKVCVEVLNKLNELINYKP